jgi:hypothetical protein
MADTHRVMIRLSPDLYAQLAARGSSGQPLAAIVRQALMDYLARQPEQPAAIADLEARLTALTTSLQELHAHVRALAARVDRLAAPQQPGAAEDNQGAATTPRPPAAMADTASPETPARRRARKLTPRQIRALRDKHLRGVPIPALLDEYGISRASLFRYLQSDKRGG